VEMKGEGGKTLLKGLEKEACRRTSNMLTKWCKSDMVTGSKSNSGIGRLGVAWVKLRHRL